MGPAASSTWKASRAPDIDATRTSMTSTLVYVASCWRAARRKSSASRAVSRDEVVNVLGHGVAPRPGVAEQHTLARAPERERGGQTGRASSYDDDVVEHQWMPSVIAVTAMDVTWCCGDCSVSIMIIGRTTRACYQRLVTSATKRARASAVLRGCSSATQCPQSGNHDAAQIVRRVHEGIPQELADPRPDCCRRPRAAAEGRGGHVATRRMRCRRKRPVEPEAGAETFRRSVDAARAYVLTASSLIAAGCLPTRLMK